MTQLSNNEADVTEMSRIYDDVLTNLAAIPILVRFFPSIAPAGGIMALPSGGVNLLLAFYNGQQLGELSTREANWLFPDWREVVGTPYNYTRQSFNAQQVHLIPSPNDGLNGAFLVAHKAETLPVWLQLPVALLVLADEYGRESAHQKIEIATAARGLGQLLLACIMRRLSDVLQSKSKNA